MFFWIKACLSKNLPFIETDFVVYSAESGLENLSPETCLLAIEIGDSSLAYDLGRKAKLYAEFGIGELWVIDVPAGETVMHRNPQDDAYAEITRHSASETLTPVSIPQWRMKLEEALP